MGRFKGQVPLKEHDLQLQTIGKVFDWENDWTTSNSNKLQTKKVDPDEK